MNQLIKKNNLKEFRFAFLIHPRGFEDIYVKYPIARYIPKWLLRKILLMTGPLVVGKIYGLKTNDGEEVKGEIIAIPMTGRDMMKDRKKASREVERGVKLASNRGNRIIGLGSLTSVVVSGGVDMVGKYKTKITNGNALTVFMAFEGIRTICQKKDIDMSKAKFAIIGATGSIGSGISKLLIRDGGVQNAILIGRTPEHLQKAKAEFIRLNPNLSIEVSDNLTQVADVDVVVVATSAEGTILTSEKLKKNAIIYDVTQPQNVSKSISLERPDVVVVDGAISKLPEGVGYTTKMGLSKGEAFSCMAETMILAKEKYKDDFSVGHVSLENVDTIARLARENGFKRAPLRSWGKIIL